MPIEELNEINNDEKTLELNGKEYKFSQPVLSDIVAVSDMLLKSKQSQRVAHVRGFIDVKGPKDIAEWIDYINEPLLPEHTDKDGVLHISELDKQLSDPSALLFLMKKILVRCNDDLFEKDVDNLISVADISRVTKAIGSKKK